MRRWVLRGGSLVIIAFNKFEKIKHFNLHILGFKGDPVLDGLFGSQKPNDFSLVWLDSNKEIDEMAQMLRQEYPESSLHSDISDRSEARSDESQDSRCGSITTSTAPPSCTVSSVRVTAPQSCVVSASGTPSTAPLSRTLSSLHSDISDRWSEAMSDLDNAIMVAQVHGDYNNIVIGDDFNFCNHKLHNDPYSELRTDQTNYEHSRPAN